MPRYTYACSKCKYQFEDYHLMSEPHPKRCPSCGKNSLGQSFDNHNITAVVYGNPTTIGQAAEENTKRLGKERHEKMIEDDFKARKLRSPKKKPETPWYRNGSIDGTEKLDKPLEVSKIKNVKKFIETGEKE